MLISDTWSAESIAKIETLYHNANGYIGVRNSPEEGKAPKMTIRGTYINGVYELLDITYGEKLAGFPEIKQTICNLPDAQTVRISLGDETYSMFGENVTQRRQELDIHAGRTLRSALWNGEKGVRVEFERIASFDQPNLFLLRTRLTSLGWEGKVTLCSTLNPDVTNFADDSDPRVAAEPLRCLEVLSAGIKGQVGYALCQTLRSKIQVGCFVAHDQKVRWMAEGNQLEAVLEKELSAGQSLTLDKYVVYVDSKREQDVASAGEAKLSAAMKIGAAELFRRQTAYMEDLMDRAFVKLDASEELMKALDYDLFELIQSTGHDGLSNVAAKGLSGEGYEGHTFWDSEVYVFPFFLWTQPEKAREMLKWRHSLLERARANARSLGFTRGALYPWRTINGDECSAFFPAGTAQYHINGDISYAVLQYWHVTGDVEFMEKYGAEILLETARLWLELGHMTDRGFCIDCVTGPDEYTCLVNNNFYTNAVAQYNLCGAADVLEMLLGSNRMKSLAAAGFEKEEISAFRTAGERMYLPYDEKLNISPQDDSFLQKKRLDWKSLPRTDFPLLLHYHPLFLYRHQVCKQADTVLAHLLFPETADRETVARSFEYYDEVTTHDSSLSVCVFATLAARLGNMKRALDGFEATATLDLYDHHGNTKDGLHTASLGGAYLAMLMGFAGVRATREGMLMQPILPEAWGYYEMPLRYQGKLYRLQVNRDSYLLLDEENREIFRKPNGEQSLVEKK